MAEKRYTVKTTIDNGRGFPIHLQKELRAPSAQEAIRRGHRAWGAEGYPGPFRGTSAENTIDAHDYARDTV